MMECVNGTECIGVREFPPFIRITLGRNARKEVFSQAVKEVEALKREHSTSRNVFEALHGKKKGRILTLLSGGPQPARRLVEESELSPSAVYHFLSALRRQNKVVKEGRIYSLVENNERMLSLADIVRVEEDPLERRRYGISISELELAYFLWDRFMEVAPQKKGYARTYQNMYTLADAVHRWKTGRTDMPVWALERLVALSSSDVAEREGSVAQYQLPPGMPVTPYFEGEYKLPIHVDSNLDKVVIQLLQKLSKNHLYTFPKKREWLFTMLHATFGKFDDSRSRIPSAITEVLKSYYGVGTLNRSLARIPSQIKSRWNDLDSLYRLREESSLLLHILSLSSKSNGGYEITSRSKPFLEDLSHLTENLGLGDLTVRKKHSRPHFRAYLSEKKVDVLENHAYLFSVYPDLEIWMRIPLSKIAENVAATGSDHISAERVCREELGRFVESILRSLERRRKERSPYRANYMQYREEIADYFWEKKIVPSARRVEERVRTLEAEAERLVYA